MKFSKLYAPTAKEAPKDASLASHKFLLRAGYAEQVGSGLYNFLPLGKRVLENIKNIVKEELDEAGAQEISMSFVTSADLWRESGRYEFYGKELLRFKDRKENDFVLSPTNEESVVALVRGKVTSYKQLPLNLYHVNTKFRDEARPRFGLLRGREFIMKDAYSFHASADDLDREFDLMEKTYSKIFTRLGLNFRAVRADSGAIGGSGSKEFMVLANSGEDELQEVKAQNACGALELADATETEIAAAGLVGGFCGPVGLKGVEFYIDNELRGESQMICGANERDYHFVGVSVSSFNAERFKDLTAVKAGDKCPCCGGNLSVSKGIEVGHIFKLGTKYSEPMGATFLDENGKAKPFIMGCYGIGVSRLVAVAVEASHDEKGIIWNETLTPFKFEIIISNLKDEESVKFAQGLYEDLREAGVSVLLDDRNERFGVKMSEFELMGFPYAVIVGKGLAEGTVELVTRGGLVKETLKASEILARLKSL